MAVLSLNGVVIKEVTGSEFLVHLVDRHSFFKEASLLPQHLDLSEYAIKGLISG